MSSAVFENENPLLVEYTQDISSILIRNPLQDTGTLNVEATKHRDSVKPSYTLSSQNQDLIDTLPMTVEQYERPDKLKITIP